MGEQFYLKWNNHQKTLIGVFDSLLGTEKYADCILAAEGRILRAHKVVLSACSPYLEYLLNQQGTDKHPILIFNDIKFAELKAMLDYMYKGEVHVLQEQFNNFLKAAKSLQVKGLTDQGGGGGGGGGGTTDDEEKETKAMHTEEPKRKTGGAHEGRRPHQLPLSREESVSPLPSRKKRKRRSSEESGEGGAKAKAETGGDRAVSLHTPPAPPPPALFQAKAEPHDTPLQPKTEFLDHPTDDDQPVEDLTLEEEEEEDLSAYMADPGTSLGPDHSQDYNSSWQLGDQGGGEAYLGSQEVIGNQNNSQGWLTNGERVKRDHSYVQEAAVRCDDCGKLYRHRRHLKRHVLVECGKEPQLRCPLCPYRSLRQTTLSRHLKLKH